MLLNIIVYSGMRGNRLRVGVLVLKTLACRGLRVGPSKLLAQERRTKVAKVGPMSRDIAILSLPYPRSRDTFEGKAVLPQNGAIPPLGTSFQTGTSVRYPILQRIVQ